MKHSSKIDKTLLLIGINSGTKFRMDIAYYHMYLSLHRIQALVDSKACTVELDGWIFWNIVTSLQNV